jgi:hypothetical protein
VEAREEKPVPREELNIYIVSGDPREAAKFLCDVHVGKALTMSAHILCTVSHHWRNQTEVLRISDELEGTSDKLPGWAEPPLPPSNQDHPCVLWARGHYDNFWWLTKHAMELVSEFKFRFAEEHRLAEVIRWCARAAAPPPMTGLGSSVTPFAQVMPDWIRSDNPVHSYRLFYALEKADIAKWTRRREPPWWKKYRSVGEGCGEG